MAGKTKTHRMLCGILAAILLGGCAAPGPEAMPDSPVKQPTLSVLTPTAPAQVPTEPAREPEHTATTLAQLQALTEPGSLEAGDTVRICGSFSISEPVVFSLPVSLILEGTPEFSEPIRIETRRSGEIRIFTASEIKPENIVIDAPFCELTWENSPFSSWEGAAELLNVRCCNGLDLTGEFGLGGTGEKSLSGLQLQLEDQTVDCTLMGNLAVLSVSYLLSDEALRSSQVLLTFPDGTRESREMDMSPGEHTLTVADDEGEIRTYRLAVRRLTYRLPVVYIETQDGKQIDSREEYLAATVRIDTETAQGDFPELPQTQAQIRGRGHYSWKFDKKSFKLRFEKKTSVLGMEASKNWVLIANYVDRSLIQNHVALEMGKVLSHIPYHSSQYPVDVFVNGSYRGVYTLGEQLEVKPERIVLDENTGDANTDYLLEVGGSDEGDILGEDYFHAGTLRFVAVKHPDSSQLSREQMEYIISYVLAADAAVKNLEGYEEYIDIDSLIDWVILHELTYNLDSCFRRSCYLIKEKDGKLKMGPIWDFDLGFGSFYRYEKGDWATVGAAGEYVGITWMNYLMEDPAFLQRFTDRWNDIGEPLLEAGLEAVRVAGERVAPSARMNFEVWDILGKSVPSQPSSHKKYDTYEKMLGRLEKFLRDRYDWMDRQLNG